MIIIKTSKADRPSIVAKNSLDMSPGENSKLAAHTSGYGGVFFYGFAQDTAKEYTVELTSGDMAAVMRALIREDWTRFETLMLQIADQEAQR